MHNNIGKVTLVGAGPGDIELLTVKAYKAIEKAEVILYDALVNKKMLNINSTAEKVFVGKRLGYKKMPQQNINQLMVEYAKQNKNVVRLKGGDCFVFGRAHEELEWCQWNNVKTEVIPGISSYTGIAATNQIPLTKRNQNESFWVTTGYTVNGEISADIPLAAQSSATVIILMGMSKLGEIVSEFKKHKSSEYPVAIIQNGTTHAERSVVGTLGDIEYLVQKHEISNPANIIMGYAAVDNITQYNNLLTEVVYT